MNFSDIVQPKELRGLDSFFGKFPKDHALCDFCCDVLTKKDFWPRVEPVATKIIKKIGPKRKILLNSLREQSKKTTLRVEREKYVAFTDFRVDLNFVPRVEIVYGGKTISTYLNATQEVVEHRRGNKIEFLLVGFDPQVLYSNGHLNFYFSMFAGFIPGVMPHYVLSDHLIERMKRLENFAQLSTNSIKFYLLGQLSSKRARLLPFWAGRGNEVIIRSHKGAFLGEAISVDTPAGDRNVFFLKTFVAEYQLFDKQKSPPLEHMIDDCLEDEMARFNHYRLPHIYPYRQTTDEEFDALQESMDKHYLSGV